MRGRGGAGRSEGGPALAWRIARHVIGGLLTGAVVGYLAALILPRRYPAPAGSYQAPVPHGAGLPPGPGQSATRAATTVRPPSVAAETG